MSITHLAVVADLEAPTVACKSLLWALASSSDLDGNVRRNIPHLARRSGMTERAVRDNLRKLAERGFIAKTDLYSKDLVLTFHS